MPYVTGKKYRVWWGVGLDWSAMKLELSDLWEATDKGIYFVHPYVEARAGGFPITTSSSTGANSNLAATDTLDGTAADTSGLNKQNSEAIIEPATTSVLPKELTLYVDGKDADKKTLSMKAYKCKENKCLDPLADVVIEGTERKWDNQASWTAKNPNKTVPKCDGSESLIVEAGWNMVYDIAGDSCPGGKPYKTIIVHGRLTLKRKEAATPQDINLRAKHIFVTGELIIGTKLVPVPTTDNFKITLYGEYAADTVVYDGAIEAGNKVIASIGKVDMFGSGPAVPVQKLLADAPKD